jgi:hypothetical protein
MMLALMLLRIQGFNREEFVLSTQRQLEAQEMLVKEGVPVPGHKVDHRNFW